MAAKVTLVDVARRAGVSQAAASKVFNDRADVSATTAAKVRQAAQELGYRAPVHKGSTDRVSIWITIDTVNNYYAPGVLSGMLMEGQSQGALTVVSQIQRSSANPAPGSKKWIANAHRQGAQAFIFVTTTVTEQALEGVRQLGVPLVVVDPINRPPDGVVTVGATNFRGGRDAVDHLIGLGHRHIAYVGARLDSTPGSERLAGYLDALRHADLPVDRSLILPGRFTSDDGRAAARLLERENPPTAIFAASDAVAFGLYDACHEQGIHIPEDVSIVGFDDALGGELVWPHLTTVRQPLMEMGRHAVRICITAVQTEGRGTPPIELTTSLVIRDSTGPASQSRT